MWPCILSPTPSWARTPTRGAPAGHEVVERPSDDVGSSGVTFALERGQICLRVGAIDIFEVQADAVGIVREGEVLDCGVHGHERVV
jgi:hypothetical protein